MKTMKELLSDVVGKLSYKPGWTFAVEEYAGVDGTPIIALHIKADAICIDSGDPITIDRTFVASGGKQTDLGSFLSSITPREFVAKAFVANCIETIEEHEQHEWLKFAGERWHDNPHGTDGYED